jgi:hypothetical protein
MTNSRYMLKLKNSFDIYPLLTLLCTKCSAND